MHGRAGEVPVDILVVIESRDQPVELGARLGFRDTTFQFAHARRDYGAVKTFGGFGEPIDVAGHHYHSLLVVLADLVGATLIFVCVGFYYRLQHHQRITPDEREQTSFIAAKKVVALSLFAGFLLIAVTAAVRYLRGRATFDLFGDFFTLLIFADILIVLVSLAFTSGYPVVFRNAGFAAAAVLIRLALTAPPFVSVALGVGAALFAVGLTAAYNSFAPGTGEPFRPRGSVLRM